MSPLEISHRLNVSGPAPDRSVLLPELPGATPYQPGMLDRTGEQLQRSTPLVAASGIAGSVVGAKLLRLGGGGIFRGMAGGIAGALAGVSIGMVGLALARGTRAHHEPSAPVGVQDASTRVAGRERVTVMTWNLHGGMGGPGEYGSSDSELDALADVIRREHPDVLLLQEVDRFATRSGYTDVLAELDERLGADSAVGGTAVTTVTGRDQDVPVMTFNGFTVTDARNVVHPDADGAGFAVRFGSFLRDAKAGVGSILGTEWTSGTTNSVRNTIEAMVQTPGGSNVRVLSGHYEWPEPGQEHQDRQVGDMSRGLAGWDGPTIWGADFNVRGGGGNGVRERALLARAGLVDAFDAAPDPARVPMSLRSTSTSEASSPDGGIDRIYASRHADVIETRVVREAGEASDHLPVVTELALVPGTGS